MITVSSSKNVIACINSITANAVITSTDINTAKSYRITSIAAICARERGIETGHKESRPSSERNSSIAGNNPKRASTPSQRYATAHHPCPAVLKRRFETRPGGRERAGKRQRGLSRTGACTPLPQLQSEQYTLLPVLLALVAMSRPASNKFELADTVRLAQKPNQVSKGTGNIPCIRSAVTGLEKK